MPTTTPAAAPPLAADAETDTDDFDTLLARQPPTHLVSGRLPKDDGIAGYFHTGGTTGTPKLVQHSHANQVYQAWGLRLMGLAERCCPACRCSMWAAR